MGCGSSSIDTDMYKDNKYKYKSKKRNTNSNTLSTGAIHDVSYIIGHPVDNASYSTNGCDTGHSQVNCDYGNSSTGCDYGGGFSGGGGGDF